LKTKYNNVNKKNTVMAKKELTISEFREMIKEEALKLKKRMVLENEKKALQAELKTLMNESYGEGEEMEEGWFSNVMNTTQGGQDMFMQDLSVKARSLAKLTGNILSDMEREELISQAKADNFGGALQITARGPEGKLVYINSGDAADRSGSVTSINR
jgi:hypothetical protein